jgi:hypothetical protein
MTRTLPTLADLTRSADNDPRLHGTLFLLGVPMHVECIPVRDADDGNQEAWTGVDGDDLENARDRLKGLHAEFSDTGFQTVSIGGRAYVVVVFPHDRC